MLNSLFVFPHSGASERPGGGAGEGQLFNTHGGRGGREQR